MAVSKDSIDWVVKAGRYLIGKEAMTDIRVVHIGRFDVRRWRQVILYRKP